MNVGEGAAFLLLERDGDAPLRFLGIGESSDAFHMSAPHPEGAGARLAMERALAAAGVAPEEVDHVNAHGTGTKSNDAAEAIAIAGLFGDRVPVSSTKGYTGHMLGAAGATEAVLTLACLEHGFVPASAGAEPVDPEVRARIAVRRIDAPLRVALSNSFAFGGSNAALVLGRSDA
jgi:3-oxoacyl-[acyl-carrier-protein] synthase-1